jgi:hypothetical protein
MARWQAAPPGLASWLLDRAFDGTHIGGDWKGWPLCWWRSALVWLATKLMRAGLLTRVLWTTLVHSLGVTRAVVYTLCAVLRHSDEGRRL